MALPRRMTNDVMITERGTRNTCLGPAMQIKVCTPDYRVLTWREVWEAFAVEYPGQWAVQVFPPKERLIDSKAVYHLFVLENEPLGLSLK